jgi:Tfp pilus assembly protein PilV
MKCRSDKGFTLVEVVMATVILMIGVTAISSVISTIMRKNFYSQKHTQAVLLAQNKIEELINEGYESSNCAEGDYENPLNPVDSTGDSSGVFYQYWSIEDLRPIAKSKQIVSTIEWEEADGITQTVVLTGTCIDYSN